MSWSLFTKIITDLQSLNYSENVALHNYNEPLLNERIFEEISFVKLTLPSSKTTIFTNGDFIDFETIINLNKSRLDNLRITIYPNKINKFPTEKVIKNWIKKHNLEGFNWSSENMPDNKGIYYYAVFEETNIKVISPNIQTYNTRADLINPLYESTRFKPCNMTTVSAAIDYLGRFKMCCNIFPETEIHKEYVLGDLNINSFYELWSSDFMNLVRKNHLKADWSMSKICEKCYKLNENE